MKKSMVSGELFAITRYSVPVRSVYYPVADMITWAVRISGRIRNRWFLASGTISVGMELASKERLNLHIIGNAI